MANNFTLLHLCLIQGRVLRAATDHDPGSCFIVAFDIAFPGELFVPRLLGLTFTSPLSVRGASELFGLCTYVYAVSGFDRCCDAVLVVGEHFGFELCPHVGGPPTCGQPHPQTPAPATKHPPS